jgi:hypothetical protein
MLLEIVHIKISIYISLAVIVLCLVASILYSKHHERRKALRDAAAES